MIDFYIPLRLVSESNQRGHWGKQYRRNVAQQEEVSAAMHNALRGKKVALPCSVKLIRIAPRALDPGNLEASFKHVQDAVAKKLGVNDGDRSRVSWEYHQKVVRERVYGVKVQII